MCVLLFQIFQLVLIAVTLGIATMPFTFYMIPTEDVQWFCDSTAEEMNAYFATSGDDSFYVQQALDGKTYVDEADAVINARTSLMCTSDCACANDNWDAWGESADSSWVNGGTVTNWSECAALIEANPPREGNPLDAIATYFDGLLGVLENDFNCQGICTPGNFFLFKEVDDGPPGRGCLPALKEDFTSSAFAGMIVLFVVAGMDLLLFICMFGMFKKDD